MDDKKLFEQLNKLKDITPNKEWKDKNRGLLMNQIYASKNIEKMPDFNWVKSYLKVLPSRVAKTVSQPVTVVFLLFVIIFGGGIASMKASENTKPGDPLYIAKIISEKTQQAFTFDEKEKAQLGIKFAGNRVREINQLLQAEDIDKEERVEKLVQNLRKEIKDVKSRLAKMNEENVVIVAEENPEDSSVFSANLGKDEKGIQISENGEDEEIPGVADANDSLVAEVEVEDKLLLDEEGAISSSTKAVNTELILKQAEDLLDQEEYEATLDMLHNVDDVINDISIESGEVLGIEESAASSTEK